MKTTYLLSAFVCMLAYIVCNNWTYKIHRMVDDWMSIPQGDLYLREFDFPSAVHYWTIIIIRFISLLAFLVFVVVAFL